MWVAIAKAGVKDGFDCNHNSSIFYSCLDICIAILASNEVTHTDMCWGESSWVVLGKHAYGVVERRDMTLGLSRNLLKGRQWVKMYFTSLLKMRMSMSDTVSFKKRNLSKEKHREGEIYSFSFIWHCSFVILWEIFCPYCFCPLGTDWSAHWDLLYVSESIRFDILWFIIEESISGWICHFEA